MGKELCAKRQLVLRKNETKVVAKGKLKTLHSKIHDQKEQTQ